MWASSVSEPSGLYASAEAGAVQRLSSAFVESDMIALDLRRDEAAHVDEQSDGARFAMWGGEAHLRKEKTDRIDSASVLACAWSWYLWGGLHDRKKHGSGSHV